MQKWFYNRDRICWNRFLIGSLDGKINTTVNQDLGSS